MSLKKLHEVVTNTAEKAYMQKDTQDILNMAAATLQMAQAYQLMKECEIHEKYHQFQDQLPGEGTLKGPEFN